MKRTLQTNAFYAICFVVMLCCNANLVFSQNTWTGATSTDWNTAGNWTAGVPDAADAVTIPNVTNDPVISVAGAVAQLVYVASGAVLTIGASGILTIEGHTDAGLYNEGTVENSGTINIGTNVSPGLEGIVNQSIFNNNVSGIINVDRTGSTGIRNGFSPGTFTNMGIINIGALGSVGTYAIQNSSATFNNATCTARINIISNNTISNDGTFDNAGVIIENASGISSINSNTGVVQNLNGGTFTVGSGNVPVSNPGYVWIGCVGTNWADAANWSLGTTPTTADEVVVVDKANDPTISAAGAVAKSVLVSSGATLTIGASGTLTIEGSGSFLGLYNGGTVENNGTLHLGPTLSPGEYAIYNEATFHNNANGAINIDRALLVGIYNKAPSGDFANLGTINVGATASNGPFGIANEDIFNNTGGAININLSSTTGIYNLNNSTFTNSAAINIGATASVGTYGIQNSYANFNNTSGQIHIDNASSAAIYVLGAGGNFDNQSGITIGANIPVSNLLVGNPSFPAMFTNNTGGNLTGSGTFQATYFANAGGTLSPGNSPGTMTFDADEDFSNSTLSIEINGTGTPGTDFDQVVINGTATLGGTLNLVIDSGYSPSNGDQIAFLDATAISGTFSSITGASGWFLNYNFPSAGKVTLSFGAPLPVELIDFTGKESDGQVMLKWYTVTEINNLGFEVERSGDGREWEGLGFMAGAGNSFEVTGYDFLDEKPLAGVNYYRLRQMDFDGKQEFSRVVSVDLKTSDDLSNSMKLFPNPAKDLVNLRLAKSFDQGCLEIFDAQGRSVKQLNLSANTLQYQIETNAFLPGLYLVKIETDGEMTMHKLVVK